MPRAPRILAVVAAALACASVPANAQRAFDLQIFQPAPGTGEAISLPAAAPLAHGVYTLSLHGSYARGLLSRRADCDAAATVIDSSCLDTGGVTPIMPHLGQVELGAALGLNGVVELGLVAPLVIARVADDVERPSGLQTQVGVGDLRLAVATPLLRAPLALSLRFEASVPSGDGDALAGARSWTAMPQLVGGLALGTTRLGVTLGYRLRERERALDLQQDDELDLGMGARLPLLDALDLRPELRARLGVQRGDNGMPIEGDLAAGLRLGAQLELQAGVGAGLWPGREGYGAPELRVFAGVRWRSSTQTCSTGPEDIDGYRDDDGCGDPDNDGDGRPDVEDVCPLHAEDRDRFEDGDGCPDPDNDADGLVDTEDSCPTGSEDRDGFEDHDGCPEPDNDGDGRADGVDRCPLEPEDPDGFEDADGCPEAGPKEASVTVGEGRLLVSERIYFEYDRDTVRDVSLPVLDRLAEAIMALPAGTVVVVEGHTDDAGPPEYNLDLSYRRARAVVLYLRSRGVPAGRLRHRGMGDRRPLVQDRSLAGRALNRRVEFLLER